MKNLNFCGFFFVLFLKSEKFTLGMRHGSLCYRGGWFLEIIHNFSQDLSHTFKTCPVIKFSLSFKLPKSQPLSLSIKISSFLLLDTSEACRHNPCHRSQLSSQPHCFSRALVTISDFCFPKGQSIAGHA